MEKREILIANNRDQSKYRILTTAETLGELQDDIARNEEVYKMSGNTWIKNTNRIDLSGLTFTEGITKTQLLSRESALPTNVQFKGQTTNNLVMLLTNTNKQIRSGAGDRKEAYRLVKELGLAETIKENEGDNFTRCKTEVLWQYIQMAQGSPEEKPMGAVKNTKEFKQKMEVINKVREEIEKEFKDIDKPTVKSAPHADLVELLYLGVKYLSKTHSFVPDDLIVLANLIAELGHRLNEEQPKITTDDMDDMLDDLLG